MSNWKEAEESFNQLINLKIDGAYIDEASETVILTSDHRTFKLIHPVDCCEYVYFQHANNIEFLIGATINSVDFLECKDSDDENQVVDKDYQVYSYGFNLHTNKGTVTIETRLETNSCYGGEIEVVELKNYIDWRNKPIHYSVWRKDKNLFIKTVFWGKKDSKDCEITSPAVYKPIENF